MFLNLLNLTMTSQLPPNDPDSTLLNRRLNPVKSALFGLSTAVLLAAGCGESSDTEKKNETSPATAKVTGQNPGAPAVEDSGKGAAFAAEAAKRVADKPNVRGDDPAWFFLVRELKQMALGKFWEKDWAEVAENGTDPVPAMVEFKDLLAAKGIDLFVVPVPAKASIYPDKLDADFSPGDPNTLGEFFERMREQGLTVIDIEPLMRQRRAEKPGEKLWCEQDAHYTPLTCQLTAELIATELKAKDWYADSPKQELKRGEPATLEIVGDQVKDSEWDGKTGKETLTVQYAGRDAGGSIEPVEPDRESPVLLLGDSHALVFHEGASGGMHCRGAGLFDQLSYECQFPLDLVGVRGSGQVQARKQLFFTASPISGYWEKKKAVIWLFSAREFTQSFDKIIPIPIERP